MAKTNAPELMSIFTPGGSMSTPALIASKHCSSGTGVGVHLCGMIISVRSLVELGCPHAARTS